MKGLIAGRPIGLSLEKMPSGSYLHKQDVFLEK